MTLTRQNVPLLSPASCRIHAFWWLTTAPEILTTAAATPSINITTPSFGLNLPLWAAKPVASMLEERLGCPSPSATSEIFPDLAPMIKTTQQCESKE